MLESKAQTSGQSEAPGIGDTAQAISPANLLRIETCRTQGGCKRGWTADFDFLGAITAFFSAAWSTDRVELQPIPVRVRDRF